MLRVLPKCLVMVLVGSLLGSVAHAASSTSSLASEGSSASVGSLSTSVQKSSQSSTGGDKVADGDYRVMDIATAAQDAGRVRVTLQAINGVDGGFQLILHPDAVQQGRLAVGTVITARQQAYGLQFTAGTPREPFFLALRDEWFQDLQTRAVQL